MFVEMACLSVMILMMRGYGGRLRSHDGVGKLFNSAFPNRNPVSNPGAQKTIQHFHVTGNGKPKSATNKALLIDVKDANFPTINVSQKSGLSQTSLCTVLQS